MAIVKFVSSNCPMNNIFSYVMNTKKNRRRGVGFGSQLYAGNRFQ